MPELWDVYDAQRNLIGYTVQRGRKFAQAEYHLVAELVLVNATGELLMTQRSARKSHAGQWEFPGGAMLAGEDSLTGICREIAEEIGVQFDADSLVLLSSTKTPHLHLDTYGAKGDIPLSQLILQESEVSDARWVSPEELETSRCPTWVVPSSFESYNRAKDKLAGL